MCVRVSEHVGVSGVSEWHALTLTTSYTPTTTPTHCDTHLSHSPRLPHLFIHPPTHPPTLQLTLIQTCLSGARPCEANGFRARYVRCCWRWCCGWWWWWDDDDAFRRGHRCAHTKFPMNCFCGVSSMAAVVVGVAVAVVAVVMGGSVMEGKKQVVRQQR